MSTHCGIAIKSEKGYEVIRIEKEEKDLEILYKDEYQVLALRN